MIGRHCPGAFQVLQMKTGLVWMGLLALLLLPAGGWSAGGDLIAPPWPYVSARGGSQDLRASAVDAEGNLILVGATGADPADYLVVKIAADGSGPVWPAATFDLAGGHDVATAVAVDRQGNILVTGYGMNGASFDVHTIKYDGGTGAVLWQDTWGASGVNDYATAIAVDDLNNVYVAGYTPGASGRDDCLLIKYSPDGPDLDGEPLWKETWNHSAVGGHDRIHAVAAGADGVAAVGESQTAAGNFDLLVLKYGFNGAPAWSQERRYLSADGGDSRGQAVRMDAAGNVVAAGYVYNGTDAKKDFWVAKYPAGDGPALWAPAGIDNGFDDEALALAIDAAGDIYAAGTTFFLATSKDLLTVRYDGSTGSRVWTAPYNSVDGNSETALALAVDAGGDLFVGGYLDEAATGDDDFLVLKYKNVKNPDGSGAATLLWATSQGSGERNERAIGLGLHGGQVLVAGWSDRGTAELPDLEFIVLGYDPGDIDRPTGLTAQVVSNTEVALAWQDNSANEEEFIIERRAWDMGEWEESGRVLTPATSYSDSGLDPDTRYTYRVLAANSTDGISNPSDPVTVRTTVISNEPPAAKFLFNGGDDDFPAAIAVGPDGHPVVTGHSFTLESAADYYTIKLERTLAAELWHGFYDDPDSESDYAEAVAVDGANQVIVTGFASLYGGGNGNTNDVYTLWYAADGLPRDANGNSEKLRGDQYNGPSGGDDRSSAVAAAVDGSNNSVVVGYGQNAAGNDDLYVLKFRPDRSRAWTATPYDSGGDDYPAAVAFDGDGDIFVGGYTWNGSSRDFFAAKYRGTDGAMLWKARFDQAGGNDYIEDLAVDAEGHFYVTGYSANAGGNGDFYTIKYDGAGDGVPVNGVAGGRILWQQGYDGGGYDKAEAVRIDPVTGDVLVAGTTFKEAGNHDFRIIRYTAGGEGGAGKEVWAKTLDQPTDDSVAAMEVDWSGTACVVGVAATGTDSNMLAVKFDRSKTVVGANVFSGSAGREDEPVAVAVNTYGEAFVAGFTTNGSGNADYLVFKAEGEVMQAPIPLAATQSYTRVELTWVDHSLNEAGFRIERKTGACGENLPWVWVANTDPDTTSYADESLNAGATYCYRAASFNAGGELSPWLEVEVTTSEPPPPGELTCEVRSTTEIALSWHDTTAGEDVFRFERCSGAVCETFDVGENKESHLDNSAAVCAGGTYSYRVQARRTNAWVSPWSNVCSGLTTPAPTAPADLIVPQVRENAVELAWRDTTADESLFVIERCAGRASDCLEDVQFDGVGNSPAGIGGLQLHYRMEEAAWSGAAGEVRDSSGAGKHGTGAGGANTAAGGKYGRAGSFDGSNDYVATPLAIDQSASSAGATLQAWARPDADSTGQRFVLGTDNGGSDWGLLLVDSTWHVATGESYYNTGVAASLGQWQHVAAVFTPGTGIRFYKNGAWVDIVQIGYDTSTATLQVGRMGNASSYFKGLIDEVAVFNRPLAGGEISTLYQYGIGRYADATPAHSTWYTYRVRAHKEAGCQWDSPPSNSVEVQTVPAKPDNLVATVLDTTRVRLQWRGNTNTQTGFRIYRGGSEIGTVGPSTFEFTDPSACPDTSYSYQVSAFRSGEWESALSEPASAKTAATSVPAVGTPSASEERIELDWTYPSKDFTGFHLSRCQVTAEIDCTQDDQFQPLPDISDAPAGALLHYRMDETAWSGAGAVRDNTASGNHGTAYNSLAPTASGKYGSAGSFTAGLGHYIATPVNIDQASASPGVTFEAWVYPTDTTYTYRHIFGTDNGGYDWGLLQYGTTWYVSTGTSYQNTGLAVTANAWQHIVAVFIPGTGIKIYKDGGTPAAVSEISYDTSDYNVSIGQKGNLTYNFNGRIDEALVYGRALTEQEVKDRYNAKMRQAQSGLPSGTTYKYRVWAYKNDGCSGSGWVGPYTQVSATTVTPPAPAPLTWEAVDTTRIDLNWTDNTTSETGYRLDHCPGTVLECDGDPNAQPPVPPTKTYDDPPLTFDSTVLAYSDTRAAVCAGTTHTYRVRAEPWPSAWAGPVEITTPAAFSPANLVVTPLTESTISLAWDDANQDETDYYLERCRGDAAVCPIGTGVFSPVETFPNTQPGRLLHYRMNEAAWSGTASDVADASGLNNHGRAYNGANTLTGGKYGRAGNFDGSNDYVATPVKVDQSSTSVGATFEAWVYTSSNAAAYRYVIGTDNGGVDWGILTYNGYWYVANGSTRAATAFTVDTNTWQHVAAVFTPGTGIRFYKNGQPTALSTITFDTSTANMAIGQSGQNNYYFLGRIDEVAVYDRALSDADILEHFQTGVNMYRFTDSGLDPATTYTYRLSARKTTSSCPWVTPYVGDSKTTLPPSAPENFTATPFDTTRIDLGWTSKTTSETGFQLQRCMGESCTDLDSEYDDRLPSPSAGSQTYSDTKACNNTTYRYRLRAVGAASDGTLWQTAWVYSEAKKTSAPTTPAMQPAQRISEVEIQLAWTDTNSDESGFRVERCVDGVCGEFITTATTYADNELDPGRTYTYRVRAYKDAGVDGCGWTSSYSSPTSASTDLGAPVLTVTRRNTTGIDLAWSDTTTSESGFRVRRCQDAGCQNFEELTPPVELAAGTTSYTDNTLCSEQTYGYQIEAFAAQNGLRNAGGGCWTRRAKVTFTSFTAKSNTYIDVPYDSDMRPDFGDIRFYDAKGKKELPYWIREKTNGVSARVWLQTGENNNIYLLYGNPNATDVGDEALFTSVYDNFRGAAIDTAKWTVTNPRSALTQNDDLLLRDVGDVWDSLLVSTATFNRAGSPIIHLNVTIPADTPGNNYFISGLYRELTSLSTSYFVYGVYWNNYNLSLREGSSIPSSGKTYAASKDYEVKIEVTEAGGAKYWIRGGAYADWTLLRETTYNYATMRLAVLQNSHEAQIHSVVVKQSPEALGAALGPEESDPACFTIATTWSLLSNADEATTGSIVIPYNLKAQAVSDTRIDLSWTDDNTDETGFEIRRCTVDLDCPNYGPLGTAGAGATTYSDNTAQSSTAYSYRVRAVKDAVACDWSSEWSDSAGDITFPAPAFGLTAQPYQGSRMTRLTWEDKASDEEGYEIEVQAWNGRFVPVGKTGPDATTYIDTIGIEPGREYIYRVRPYRGEDKSPYSNEASTGVMPPFQTGDGTCPP